MSKSRNRGIKRLKNDVPNVMVTSFFTFLQILIEKVCQNEYNNLMIIQGEYMNE